MKSEALSSGDITYLLDFLKTVSEGDFNTTPDGNNPALTEYLTDFTFNLRLSLDGIISNQIEEVMALYKTSEALAESKTKDDLFAVAFLHLRSALDISCGSYFRPDGQDEWSPYYHYNHDNDNSIALFPLAPNFIDELKTAKKPIIPKTPYSDNLGKTGGSAGNAGNDQYVMVIPELTGEKLTGVYLMNRAEKRFTISESNTAFTVMRMMKGRLDTIELLETLEQKVEERTRELSHSHEALRESEEWFSALIHNSNDLVVVGNSDMSIKFVAQSIERMLGYTREEFAAAGMEKVHPEDVQGVLENTQRVIANPGEADAVDVRLMHKNGSWRWFACTLESFLGTQAINGIIANMRDITDMKKAEAALQEAKERAEEATKLKDQFVSLVSHDLRSPLGIIAQLIDFAVAAEDGKNLLPLQKDLLQRAGTSARGLLSLIEKLLDISRLQTGKLMLEKQFCSLFNLAQAQTSALGFGAETKGITLCNELSRDIRLYADYTLLGEVMGNIISNAIKFCKEGDTITIFNPPGEPTTIAVRDTGVGISATDKESLFLHEVKTSRVGTGGERGTGLGLPYCAEIMSAHGGSLTVESIQGEGATFYIKLPAVTTTVLIVDDQPAQRGVMISMLKDISGLEIIEAEDGEKALEAMGEITPHLIITDVSMPVMDGFEFLEAVKNNPTMKSIPVIVATSGASADLSADVNMRERAFTLGAVDFVNKPLIPNDFVPRVRRYLGFSR